MKSGQGAQVFKLVGSGRTLVPEELGLLLSGMGEIPDKQVEAPVVVKVSPCCSNGMGGGAVYPEGGSLI